MNTSNFYYEKKFQNINRQINDIGFYTDFSVNKLDLKFLENLIKKKILSEINFKYPYLKKQIINTKLFEYHKISNLIDHKKLWPKSIRLFSNSEVVKIRKLNFFKKLENYFGKIKITNEDHIMREEIYWRIVRPNVLSDVGPLHADEWFWENNQWKIPKNYYRLKIWIPIISEEKNSGLVYVPKSHKKKFKYTTHKVDGKIKPLKINSKKTLIKKPFGVKPGKAVIFHDNLLHGGRVGKFKTRISVEFTMLVKLKVVNNQKLLKVK